MGNDDEIFQLEDELFNEPEFSRLVGFCAELSGSSDSHGRALDKLPRWFGKYELTRVLGRGDSGRVYLATRKGSNRKFALKLFNSELTGSSSTAEQMVQRFERDTRAAAVIDDEALVLAREVGEVDGTYFFSMDYISGTNLEKQIKSNTFSNRRTAETIKSVAESLHKLHEAGIFHRELKPGNIMIDSRNHVSILGVAAAAFIPQNSTGAAINEMAFGTVDYLSPEQVVDRGFISVESEIWSLGAIIYDCLVGQPPFRSSDHEGTLARIQRDEPNPLTRQNPKVARDLETICFKCLNKNPAKRYQSADDLAKDLHRFLEYEPIVAKREGILERGRKWARRLRFKTV